MKKLILPFFLFLFPSVLYGAGNMDPIGQGDSLDRSRFHAVLIGKGVFVGGTFFLLEDAWYDQYSRTGFHFFDDSDEWMQMDKWGHFWAGYHLGGWSASLWDWSGMPRDRAALLGAGAGLLFLSGVEVMDGFSRGWGFSLADAGTNLLGAASFYAQKRIWGEGYITPAFSYRPSRYAKYRPGLLGRSPLQRVLKDYNGQTYWLDIDPKLFGTPAPWPDWIAISLGYGASGMLGGDGNPHFNGAGKKLPSFPRYRRYFLSLDLLLKELPVKGKGWRTLFEVLEGIKLPFPSLEYSKEKGIKGHWLGP